MNQLVENIWTKLTPGSRKLESDTPEPEVAFCSLRRDWTLGKSVIFQLDQTALQYCIVKRSINAITLIDFGKVYRPQSGGALLDHAPFLSDEIERLRKLHDLRGARFGLCVPSSEIAVRTLQLPKIPLEEEKQAVYYEGDKTLPFDIDNSYWAYRRCDRFTSDVACYHNVTLMALPKDKLDETLRFFESVGITFDFINQDIEALGLSLAEMPDFSQQKPYGLLNIRPARTDISLYQGSRLKFLHHGAVGSLALGQGIEYQTESPSFFPKALENFAEGLANVVQNALDFYGAQNGLEEIETFYIYGDISYSEELVANLSSRFGVTFKSLPLDIFNFVSMRDPDQRPIIPVALPVVATATTPYILSDFTPVRVRDIQRHNRFIRHAFVTVALAILTLAGAWTAEWWRGTIAQRAYDDASQTVARFETSSAYAGYRILKEELVRQQNIIKKLEKQNSEQYLALKELSALTPSSVRLDFLQYFPKDRQQTSQITGSVISRLVAPEVILAEYVSRLDGSPLFTDVQLKTHNKTIDGKTRTVTFTLGFQATI